MTSIAVRLAFAYTNLGDFLHKILIALLGFISYLYHLDG
jgi:hypothetical protein